MLFVPFRCSGGVIVDNDYTNPLHCFTWRKNDQGYAITTLEPEHKNIRLHRLLMNFPDENIDHINGDKLDNRYNNLRKVSQRINCQNQNKHRKGKLVGATWNKHRNNWKSPYNKNGKTYHIGYFKTEKEAHDAYMEVIKCL